MGVCNACVGESSFTCSQDCGPPPITECNDGIDNTDIDTLVDLNDPGCIGPEDTSEFGVTECDDMKDNEGDGFVDVNDAGCLAPSDDDDETNCGDNVCEGGENPTSCPADCQTSIVTECSDGKDNEGDGFIDLVDSGCVDVNDDDETNCGDLICEGGETSSSCFADCAPCPTCPDQDPLEATEKVILWTPFDEGFGISTKDLSQNRYDGTLLPPGGEPSWSTGQRSYALVFNSINYVNLGNTPKIANLVPPFTIMTWLNPASFVGIRIILNPKGSNKVGQGGIVLAQSDRELLLTWLNSPGSAQSFGLNLQVGQWQHVAVTVDSSNNVRFYRNAVLTGCSPCTVFVGNPSLDNTLIGAATFGGGSSGLGFIGGIDDFIIYSRALTSQEVDYVYNNYQN